jgi:hypothetical protein
MELSRWEADSRLYIQEIPRILWISKVFSLPFSKESTTGFYPEPVEPSSHPHTLFLKNSCYHVHLGN